MPVSPALLKGFQILRVGERSTKDKKFARDEFLAAPPGTIVAPRRKGQAPTMQNAIKALAEVAAKAAPKVPKFDSVQALKGAAHGAVTVVSGDTLGAIALRMAPNLPIYGPGGSLELLIQANPQFASNPNLIFPGQVVNNPFVTEPTPAPAPAAPRPAPAIPAGPTSPVAGGAPPAQPELPSPGDVAGGSAFQLELLRQILGDELGRLLIPQMNAQIQQSLGFIAPSLTGITDPAVFRGGLQGLSLSQRPTTPAGSAATAAGTGFIPTVQARAAFPSSSIIRELLAPTSALSLSATRAPEGTIPTLAARFTGARRIIDALGGPVTGGRVASVGTL